MLLLLLTPLSCGTQAPVHMRRSWGLRGVPSCHLAPGGPMLLSCGECIPRHFACAATLVPDMLWLCTMFAWKLHVRCPVIASNGGSLG